MKIKVGDKTYPFIHPAQATSLHLIELHRQSGLTFEGIQAGLDRINAYGKEGLTPEQYAVKFLSDIDVLVAMGALVFLARRAAGEQLTLEEACDVSLPQIAFIPEAGDEAVTTSTGEELALPGSGLGGNRAVRRASTKSPSKRSRPPLLDAS